MRIPTEHHLGRLAMELNFTPSFTLAIRVLFEFFFSYFTKDSYTRLLKETLIGVTDWWQTCSKLCARHCL